MSTDHDPSIPPLTLEWDDAAIAALKQVPDVVRRVAARSVETFAMVSGIPVVTVAVMQASRAAKEAGTHPEQKTAHQKGGSPKEGEPEVARQFVNFQYYKLNAKWRRKSSEERKQHKAEFLELWERWTQNKDIILRSYSLVGVRPEADFMFWRISYDLDVMQKMTAEINHTALAGYLETPYSFLSLTKRSQYEDKEHAAHADSRVRIVPGRAKYIFVYPFVKTRDWYLKDPRQRQRVMDEHIEVGNKYNRVKINTSYSFGLDDQDFIVAFESNYPQDFLDLVMELRETESSIYTVRDTPLFTCVRTEMGEVLEQLG